MKAALLACQAALLGPALLLGPDPLLWGLLVLVWPLNTLVLALLGGRPRRRGGGGWSRPLLLALLPLEASLMRELCRITGLADELPLLVLCLLMLVHGAALSFLLERAETEPAALRRLGLQAACWLPAALLGLYAEGRLESLAGSLLQGAGGALPPGGWLRLPLAALALAALQRRQTSSEPGREEGR